MAWWAAQACLNYDYRLEAQTILEKAVDSTAEQFKKTGTIWEFYHPEGGNPEELTRKPDTEFNKPCKDYLGHNPLLAMARLWSDLAH